MGIGMSSAVVAAGVAEHHALVAGSLAVERVLVGGIDPASRERPCTPWAMSGDCSWMAVMMPQVEASKPYLARV